MAWYETRDHSPEFIELGPFMMSKRKLTYNYAQSLCANNTLNKTNCYIGYERGILNEGDWVWVQNIHISAIPINELINAGLWSIFPWQLSNADIYCQATTNITISYASNGQNYGTNVSEEFRYNEAIKLKATNVLYETVETKKGSIHFEEDIYNTQENGYVYWNVDTYINNIQHDDSDPTAPVSIADNAQWIWNYVYENKSYVTDDNKLTAFENNNANEFVIFNVMITCESLNNIKDIIMSLSTDIIIYDIKSDNCIVNHIVYAIIGVVLMCNCFICLPSKCEKTHQKSGHMRGDTDVPNVPMYLVKII